MKLLLIVIPDRNSRVMDEVGFRISEIGFRIPKAKKCWIPDSLTWGEMLICKFVSCYPIVGRCHDHDLAVVLVTLGAPFLLAPGCI